MLRHSNMGLAKFNWTTGQMVLSVLIFLGLATLQTNARTSKSELLEIELELNETTVCTSELFCRDVFPLDYGGRDWNETAVASAYQSFASGRFLQMKCHCDRECIRYGDCCLDAVAKFSPSAKLQHIDEPWTCLPLRSKDNVRGPDEMFNMYMAAKCPANWATTEEKKLVKAQCERKVTEDLVHTYIMDIPVLSLRTNRTYANIYCATCHADADTLATWNISVGCDVDLEEYQISRESMFRQENYHPFESMWSIEYEEERISCSLLVSEFKNVSEYISKTNGRRCISSVSRCKSTWPNPVDQLKCDSYTALVSDWGSSSRRPFKNPHCAKCNEVPTNNTVCYYSTFARGRVHDSPWQPASSFSFAMIFDFGFGDQGAGKKECKGNEVFDGIHNRCHAVICGAAFANQNGTCVPRAEASIGTINFLNSSCYRLIIAENQDFVYLQNGSIWLNLTDQVLGIEEFEPMEGGGNVSICADRVIQNAYFRYSAGSPQRLLSDICLIISVICLALHIGIHIVLPKLRNLPGKNLLSLSCALFFGQLLFLIGMGVRDSAGHGLCAAIGIMTHWFYLSAFFWMNIMGFDICRTFSSSRFLMRRRSPGQSNRSTFTRYSLYAWGFPTVIVTVGLVLDFGHFLEEYAPSYGTQVCWISNRRGLGILFILPVSVILFENLILFTHTVHSILQQREAAQFAVETNQSYRKRSSRQSSPGEGLQPPLLRETNQQQARNNNKDKQQIRFILYIKLGLIMGLGWTFGFLAALANIPALWYPFILFNGLQGAFIFAAFDCKRKIYYMLYYWARHRHHPADTSSNSRATGSVNKTSVSSQRFSTTVTSSLSSTEDNGRLSRIAAASSVRQSPEINGERPRNNLARRRQAAELIRRWLRTFRHNDPTLPRVIVTEHFANKEQAYFETLRTRRLTLACPPRNENLLTVKTNQLGASKM